MFQILSPPFWMLYTKSLFENGKTKIWIWHFLMENFQSFHHTKMTWHFLAWITHSILVLSSDSCQIQFYHAFSKLVQLWAAKLKNEIREFVKFNLICIQMECLKVLSNDFMLIYHTSHRIWPPLSNLLPHTIRIEKKTLVKMVTFKYVIMASNGCCWKQQYDWH